MACARCDFYVPKPSSESQLLEAKDGIQRMLVEIPLTDDERAAVESDEHAVVRLIDLLADVATPAGPTRREIGRRAPVCDPSDANAAGERDVSHEHHGRGRASVAQTVARTVPGAINEPPSGRLQTRVITGESSPSVVGRCQLRHCFARRRSRIRTPLAPLQRAARENLSVATFARQFVETLGEHDRSAEPKVAERKSTSGLYR